jgi:hypothetical protein
MKKRRKIGRRRHKNWRDSEKEGERMGKQNRKQIRNE